MPSSGGGLRGQFARAALLTPDRIFFLEVWTTPPAIRIFGPGRLEEKSSLDLLLSACNASLAQLGFFSSVSPSSASSSPTTTGAPDQNCPGPSSGAAARPGVLSPNSLLEVFLSDERRGEVEPPALSNAEEYEAALRSCEPALFEILRAGRSNRTEWALFEISREEGGRFGCSPTRLKILKEAHLLSERRFQTYDPLDHLDFHLGQ